MTKTTYNIGLILMALLLTCETSRLLAFQGRHPIRNFTPIDYKAGIQNIDFAQNRNLSVFVANNLGVLSYDGQEWKTHDFKTGKKKRSLAFDPTQNRLYMGSQGEFGYYHDDWQYTSLTPLVPETHQSFTEVWDIYLVDSEVYFCTFQGIYRYDGQKIQVIPPVTTFEKSFLVNGQVFTQDQNGQLYEIQNGQLSTPFPQRQKNEIIAGLVALKDGLLIIYKSGQIEFSTPFGVSQEHTKLSASLSGTFVNHLVQLSDNRLAIATQRAGLFLYDLQSEQIEQLSTQNGLASNACLRSFQDYSGNLWIGMQNGIALVHLDAPMRLLGQEINLQGSGYDAFDRPEGTYFTTSNGIFFLEQGASNCVFLKGTEGPAYRIQEIGGKIYAGHHTGLFLLQGQQAIRIAHTDGLWQVKQLQSKPSYAISGTYSGLYLFKINPQQVLEPVRPLPGFSASSRFMEEDQQGNLWVGQYYLGLYRLSFSPDFTEVNLQNISEQTDLPIKEQIILTRINDRLYLATKEGIYRINPDRNTLERAPEFAEVGQQPVYLLAQDEKNRIHIITEDFIAYYDPISEDNFAFVRSSLYQLRYRLNNDLLHLSTQTNKGVLFSANDGFIYYDPQREKANTVDPLLVRQISDLSQGQLLYQQLPFAPADTTLFDLSIKARSRLLKIEVDFFQFSGLENQQFRFRLEGLSKHFGTWTTHSTKEYTNLREGDYTLLVQSKDRVGQIVDGPAYNFTVQAPFYRSTFAKIFYIFFALLIVLSLLYLQRRRYRKKEAEQEKKQQAVLAQKQQKVKELQIKKDQELHRLKEERMESEIQHINKLLAASTMNLVVKNEFIESIKNDLQDVKQKSERKDTRKGIEKIVREIETNLKVQEDWEQFQYHFDSVHGDFLSRLREDYPDISPNEQKLCAFLRLNLQTKDIANILGISVRGVEVARYRLRKKLDLDTGQNLSKFILEY
jgi:ligand-binding sensor domain-containing protein/DNA-binding CsgD family transcriptional regulator